MKESKKYYSRDLFLAKSRSLKFTGVLPVHPRNSSCVTILGHYNSFITTLETGIVNVLFTSTGTYKRNFRDPR